MSKKSFERQQHILEVWKASHICRVVHMPRRHWKGPNVLALAKFEALQNQMRRLRQSCKSLTRELKACPRTHTATQQRLGHFFVERIKGNLCPIICWPLKSVGRYFSGYTWQRIYRYYRNSPEKLSYKWTNDNKQIATAVNPGEIERNLISRVATCIDENVLFPTTTTTNEMCKETGKYGSY